MESPGTKYGRLTLISILPDRSADNHIVGAWKCDCGETKNIAVSRVRTSITKSCGCMQIEIARDSHTIHGMKGTPEYFSWGSMKDRCLNQKSKDFDRYGARGISIHPDWIDSFESFYSYMGPRPMGMTLERCDTMGNYVPGNVKWANAVDQACNRRNSFFWFVKGIKFESAQFAADHFGVSDVTVHKWVKGYFDARRGTTSKPREDCYVEAKY